MGKKLAIARTLACLLAASFLTAAPANAADTPLKPYLMAEESREPLGRETRRRQAGR